jgi:hypothetical protein
LGDDGNPVAAARLTVHSVLSEVPDAEIYKPVFPEGLPGPIGVFTRLVVARSHSGLGLSGALDLCRIAAARSEGCRYAIGETFAGLPRLDQMRALGFEIAGPVGSYASGPLKGVKAISDSRVTGQRMPTAIVLNLIPD